MPDKLATLSGSQRLYDNLNSKITSETNARVTADSTLQTNIDTEASNRAAADTATNQALNTEINNRIAGDSANNTYTDSQINAERTRAETAEVALEYQISIETSARESADTALSQLISDETVARLGQGNSLNAAINQEILNRQDAVSSEAQLRTQADSTLQSNINAEALLRASADSSLSSSISTINSKIPAEATTNNKLADKQYVSSSVNVEKSRAQTAEANITRIIEDLDMQEITATTGKIIGTISQEGGQVSASTRDLLASDIPTLPESKITNLTTDLSAINSSISTINSKIPNEATSSNKLADKAFVTSSVNSETVLRTFADTTLQNNINAEASLRTAADTILQNNIDSINNKIPTEATDANKLADKAFVNSSIANMAANYVTSDSQGSSFATKYSLVHASTYYYNGLPYTPKKNDYAIVVMDEDHGTLVEGYASFTTTDQYVGYYVIHENIPTEVTSANKDTLGITPGTTPAYQSFPTSRYTYTSSQWAFQYVINNSSFTAQQLAALNSGATSSNIALITTNLSNITSLSSTKANLNSPEFTGTPKTPAVTDSSVDTAISTVKYVKDKVAEAPYVSYNAQTLTAAQKLQTKTNIGLENVDNTSDLNKPVSTATQNALNLKANIESPQFTGIPKAPAPLSNAPNDQIATVLYVNTNGGKIDKIKVNGVLQTITNKEVNITAVTSVNGNTGAVSLAVPTKTSDLTNDSGFITQSDVPVTSVNSKTGAVLLNASDVGALPTNTTYVSYGLSQNLTDAQKQTARNNINSPANVNSISKSSQGLVNISDSIYAKMHNTYYSGYKQVGSPSPITLAPISFTNGFVRVNNRNILPKLTVGSEVVSGVTISVSETGIITANGTASSDITYLIYSRDTGYDNGYIKPGQYTLSGCAANPSASTYYLSLRFYNNAVPLSDEYKLETLNNTYITFNSEFSGVSWNNVKLYLVINSGVSLNNVVFTPQLEVGTNPTEYIPYQEQTKITTNNLKAIKLGTSYSSSFSNDLRSGLYDLGSSSSHDYYIADTIENDVSYLGVDVCKNVRRILQYTFTGNETITKTNNYFRCELPNFNPFIDNSAICINSNAFIASSKNNITSTNNSICVESYSGTPGVTIYSNNWQDVESFKTYLLNNAVVVYYILSNVVITTSSSVTTYAYGSITNVVSDALVPALIKAYYSENLWDTVVNKQDKLVSSVNIKTINNQSIVGSGNVNINAGVSSVNGQTGGTTGAVVLTADDFTTESILTESFDFNNVQSKINVTTGSLLKQGSSSGYVVAAVPGTDYLRTVTLSNESLVLGALSIAHGGTGATTSSTACSNIGAELVGNKVTTITSSSTNTQYPTAKAVYDAIPHITISTAAPTFELGNNGDIWLVVN